MWILPNGIKLEVVSVNNHLESQIVYVVLSDINIRDESIPEPAGTIRKQILFNTTNSSQVATTISQC